MTKKSFATGGNLTFSGGGYVVASLLWWRTDLKSR